MANNSTIEGATAVLVDNANRAGEAVGRFTQVNERLIDSLGMLGKTAMSSEQSMSKYNSAILAGTGALGNLVALIGKGSPLGMAIGSLVKVFGVLTTSILSQNDAYLKAKDTLNQFGFSSEMTASEIAKMGRQAGYTKDELEKYTGAITSLGVDMLSLGTSFGKGSKVFMDMAAVGLDTVTQFGKMGISQEQLTRSQAHYVKLLSAQGIQITGNMASTEQLRKSSLAYTENLLTLAALSGEDIESIKRKQEAARADANFQIGQAMKAKEAAALEEEYNKTGEASLKVRADQLKKEVENAQKLQDAAIAFGLAGQDLSAFNQMIQTGTFTELSAKFAPFGEGLLKFIQDVLAGTKGVDASELPIRLAKMTDRAMDAVGKAATYGPSEIQNVIFMTTEGIKRAAQLRGMSEQDYVNMINKLVEDRKNAEKIDPLANIRANQIKLEKAAQLGLEDFTEVLRGPLMKGLEMFQKALMWVARGFLQIYAKLPGVDEKYVEKLIDELTPLEVLEDQLKAVRKQQIDLLSAAYGPSTPEEVQISSGQTLQDAQKREAELSARVEKRKAEASVFTGGAESIPNRRRMTQEELVKRFGSYIKTGRDFQKDGEYVDTRIIGLMQTLIDRGVVGEFTSLNDMFHQGRSSKHTEGKALDFKYPGQYVRGSQQHADMVQTVRNILGDFPGMSLIDEYTNPSSGATGGHFHIQIDGARRGMMPGMFDAPTSGTLMAVHNREMIAPLDPNSIIARLLTASPSEAEGIIGSMNNTDVASALKDGFAQLSDKMDTFISQVQTLNYTQEELLMYSRS